MRFTTFCKIMLPVLMIIGFFVNIIFNSYFLSMIVFCVFCMDIVYIMRYGGGFFRDKGNKKK